MHLPVHLLMRSVSSYLWFTYLLPVKTEHIPSQREYHLSCVGTQCVMQFTFWSIPVMTYVRVLFRTDLYAPPHFPTLRRCELYLEFLYIIWGYFLGINQNIKTDLYFEHTKIANRGFFNSICFVEFLNCFLNWSNEVTS